MLARNTLAYAIMAGDSGAAGTLDKMELASQASFPFKSTVVTHATEVRSMGCKKL